MTLLMSDWSIVKVMHSLCLAVYCFPVVPHPLSPLQALVRGGCFSLSSCPALLAAVAEAER